MNLKWSVILLSVFIVLLLTIRLVEKTSFTPQPSHDTYDGELRPLTNESAKMELVDRLLEIDVVACNVVRSAIFDTGSSKAVLAIADPCVATDAACAQGGHGGPQCQQIYADGTVKVHPSQKALPMRVGLSFTFQASKVDFFNIAKEPIQKSILGMSVNSVVKINTFAVTYDGHSGGYFTPNPPAPSNPLTTLSFTTQGGYYMVPITLVPHVENAKPRKMNAILDTGSTDHFVDGHLVKPRVGFTIYTKDGKIELGSYESDVVVATEGGEMFSNMLHNLNALILGLPFFAARTVTFNRAQRTVVIEKLPLPKE